MKKIIGIVFLLISLASEGQIYQSMPQAGYGPVKRMLFDSVLTLPLGLGNLRNISGGRDNGQIRFNTADSSIYVWLGSWIKQRRFGDSVGISNIYNTNGGLTSNRFLLGNNFNLNITGVNALTFESMVMELNSPSFRIVTNGIGGAGYVLTDSAGTGVAKWAPMIPKLTTSQILALVNPPIGVLYYDTSQKTFAFFDGTGWKKISHSNL